MPDKPIFRRLGIVLLWTALHLVFLFQPAATAQNSEGFRPNTSGTELTLDDIGQDSGLNLTGLQGQAEIFLPASKSLRPLEASFRLRPSPQWPGGRLRISSQDRVLKSVEVGEEPQTVTVPLDKAPPPSEESIQIQFETGLRAERPCFAARLYRLSISPQSTVSYRYRGSNQEIQDFFPPFLQQVTYYVPSPVTKEAAQTALWLSAYLSRTYAESPDLRIRERPDSTDQIPSSGAWERAVVWDGERKASVVRQEFGADKAAQARTYQIQPSDASLGNIARRFYGDASAWRRIYDANKDRIPNPHSIESGQTIRLPRTPVGSVSQEIGETSPMLVLGTVKAARQLFDAENGIDAAATPALVADTAQLQNPEELGESVSLAQLGFDTRRVRGTGEMSIPYTFSLSDFGDQRYPTGLRLRVPHTPLPEEGRGHLKVLLNGNQVTTAGLSETGTPIDEFIQLPKPFLTRDLNLEVKIDYVAPSGNCSTSPLLMSAQVDPRSSLFLEKGWAPSPGFDRFPQAFVAEFGVHMAPLTRSALSRAGRLVSALQETTEQPLSPKLYAENIPAESDLLVLGSRGLEERLNAPVQSPGTRILNQSGEAVLSFRPESPQAMLQGFKNDGRNILLLTHTSDSSALADSLLSGLLLPDGWFGVHGDFAIRGQTGAAKTLQIQGGGLEAQPFSPPPQSFFQRYRIWLFTGIALLILLFLAYTYPKLVRDEPSTN